MHFGWVLELDPVLLEFGNVFVNTLFFAFGRDILTKNPPRHSPDERDIVVVTLPKLASKEVIVVEDETLYAKLIKKSKPKRLIEVARHLSMKEFTS